MESLCGMYGSSVYVTNLCLFICICTSMSIAKRLRRLRQNEEALHELLTDDMNIQENVPQVDDKFR